MTNVRAVASTVLCTVALCAAGLLGPPGAAVALLAVPLPALVLGGMAGERDTAQACAATAVLVAALLGWQIGAFYLVLAGIPVTVAVRALRRAWPIEGVLGGAVVSLVAGLAVALWLSGGDIESVRAGLAAAWDESFDGTVALYRELGMSAEQIDELEMRREELAGVVFSLLPALVVIFGAAVWLANLGISARWAAWPQLWKLSHWRVPSWSIWILIAAGFAMFAPNRSVAAAGQNAFAMVLAGYFCQGLAIVSYFLQRFGLPRGLRIAAYALIAVQQFVAAMVLALGVFDFWGDFRRLGVRPASVTLGSDPE